MYLFWPPTVLAIGTFSKVVTDNLLITSFMIIYQSFSEVDIGCLCFGLGISQWSISPVPIARFTVLNKVYYLHSVLILTKSLFRQ
jgi:hypothetical protein